VAEPGSAGSPSNEVVSRHENDVGNPSTALESIVTVKVAPFVSTVPLRVSSMVDAP
jgi:hypothetical protein